MSRTQTTKLLSGNDTKTTVSRNSKTPSNKLIIKRNGVSTLVNRNSIEGQKHLANNRNKNKPKRNIPFRGAGGGKTVGRNSTIFTSGTISNMTRIKLEEQLVNTYLTFLHETRPGFQKKLFWRYIALMLYSMNKISNKSEYDNTANKLYLATETMSGEVSVDIQQRWANVFSNILGNVNSIPSRLGSLYNMVSNHVTVKNNIK